MTLRLELHGKVPSKKNRYRRRSAISRGRKMYRTEEDVAAIDSLIWQAKNCWRRNGSGPLPPVKNPILIFRYWVSNARIDRDGMRQTLLDVLVRAGVLRDDSVQWSNGLMIDYPAAVVNKGLERTTIDIHYGDTGLEWITPVGVGGCWFQRCPICASSKPKHGSGCSLAAVLAQTAPKEEKS